MAQGKNRVQTFRKGNSKSNHPSKKPGAGDVSRASRKLKVNDESASDKSTSSLASSHKYAKIHDRSFIFLQAGLVLIALLITFICFSPALSSKKEFTNWDDPVYVIEQKLITNLSVDNVKAMFSVHNDVSLNYHPLTVLSLAVNYHFSKLKPFGYFLTNIFIHLLNTLLVFVFIRKLLSRSFSSITASEAKHTLSSDGLLRRSPPGNDKLIIASAIAALLFGIHPMHVESVAWAAERKDVLYCFFFLSSSLVYINYLETKKIGLLIGCFILFVCSCLSKAMATPLPLILILLDFYYRRKITWQTIAEKIPFLLFALWIGITAVHIQSKEALADFKIFTLAQRIMFASYGFVMYWVKFFIPVSLSTFYPYPSLIDGHVPILYYFMPFVAVAIIAIPLFIAYNKNKFIFRLLLLQCPI